MLWLVAASVAVNLFALATAGALARAGRAPAWLLKIAFLAAAVSVGAALWSVRVVREGFRATEVAGPAEKNVVLARYLGRALDFDLASLVIASVMLFVLVGLALRQTKQPLPGATAGARTAGTIN